MIRNSHAGLVMLVRCELLPWTCVPDENGVLAGGLTRGKNFRLLNGHAQKTESSTCDLEDYHHGRSAAVSGLREKQSTLRPHVATLNRNYRARVIVTVRPSGSNEDRRQR